MEKKRKTKSDLINEKIAVFLGYKNDGNDGMFKWYIDTKKTRTFVQDCTIYSYDKSWNKLIQAVDKINSMWWTDYANVSESVLTQKKNMVMKLTLEYTFDTILKEVLKFITWHNKQKAATH